MTHAWPRVALGDLLTPIWRDELVDPSKEYRLLGARWYAGGLFLKDVKSGQEIRANRLYRVRAGDFVYNRLFAWKGSFALASDEDDGCCVSNEFPCFEIDHTRLDGNFLWSYFRRENTWTEALGLSSGATPTSRNRLKESLFLKMAMPLPPLSDQQRIVARIEELAVQVKQARELRALALEETDALWMQGAIAVLDRVGGKHSARPLADLVSLRGGGTPSKADPSYWQGTVPWITPKDMKVRELRDAVDHISERATQETAAKVIAPGAVLVVVRGMILAHTIPSAVLRAPAAINQDMKALIPRNGLMPEFICAMLWAYNRRLLGLVEKSTHDTRKLETEKLLAIPIPVPPVPEQAKVLAALDSLQDHIQKLQQQQQETGTELNALFPAILDRAFKGEL